MRIFDNALGAVFVPSQPFLLSAQRAVLDFTYLAAAAAVIEWYLEFTSTDPNDAATVWFREVAEENAGGGAVSMPNVVRTFPAVTAASAGKDCEFVRTHHFCRVQLRLAGKLFVDVPFGAPANSPA